MKTLFNLHVGMPPFIAADCSKVGCIQAINAQGKAVATVTFIDERIEQFLCIDSIDRADFMKQARTLFDETPAIRF